MKVFFPVPTLLILLVAVLLLSGCPILGPEGEAKALADQTAEAEFLIQIEQQFVKIQYCTVEEIESAVEAPPPNAEQRAQMELYIEQFKQCTPVLERTSTKQAENQYLVSYALVPPSGCELELLQGAGSLVEVEVNTETKTTNIVKGAISEEIRQNAQMMMQKLGNCAGLVVFIGTVSSVPAAVP